MKKIILLSIILLTLFSQIALAQKSNSAKKTVITGFVKEDSEKLNIIVKDISRYNEFLDKKDSFYLVDTMVNSIKGKFYFELNVDHPVYIRINGSLNFTSLGVSHTVQGILIEPGDSLNVDFNVKNRNAYDEVIISGRGSQKHLCIQKIINETKRKEDPNFQKKLEQKLLAMDSISTLIVRAIEQFSLSLTARSIIKSTFIPMLAGNTTDYINNSNVDIQNTAIKALFRKRIKIENILIDPLDKDLIYGNGFETAIIKRELMKYAMDNDIPYPFSAPQHEFIENQKRVFTSVQYDAINTNMPNGPFKEKVLSKFLFFALRDFGFTPDIENSIKKFISQTNSKSSYHDGLKNLLGTYTGRLSKGADAYPFALPDTSGKILKLRDFKGKVIVLDFMFTGCGGCATMVPYLTKVEHKYKDNPNVVFIAISTTKDINDVKKGYGNFCTDGSILLYTSGMQFTHPICWFYNPVYPQLVVIDQMGKIVSANAPKPTFDDGVELVKMINSTLKN